MSLVELAGIPAPWNITDPDLRKNGVDAVPATSAALTQALDVLERCRAWAAVHAGDRTVDELPDDTRTWAFWQGLLTERLPTVDHVRSEVLAGLLHEPHDFPDGVDPAMLPVLTRWWVLVTGRSLTCQVSRWIGERLRHGRGTPAQRERFMALLTAIAPNLDDDAAALLADLEMTAGVAAAAYLLCIARHPGTAPITRRLAHEYLDRLERRAYPQGDELPDEVWRVRGGRLSGLRRVFILRDDYPPSDQMLELTFTDGAAVQLWAGHGGELRVESGRLEPGPEECAVDVPGAEEATLLAEGVIACTASGAGVAAADSAVGRRLTDLRPRTVDGVLNGLELGFESAIITVRVAGESILDIGGALSGTAQPKRPVM